MPLAKMSAKGQVVIPAALREKCGIKPGGVVDIREVDGKIVVFPVPDDPIAAAHGMLKTGGSLLRALLEEHEEECRRDEERWRARRAAERE